MDAVRVESEQIGLQVELSDNIEVDNVFSEYNFNAVSLTSADASRMVIPCLFAGKNHPSSP
jgi:hypothetical protein